MKDGLTVWFFGTFEMASLKPAEILIFTEGLQQNLHAICKRSVKLFRAALQQAERYLKAGLHSCSAALRSTSHVYIFELCLLITRHARR